MTLKAELPSQRRILCFRVRADAIFFSICPAPARLTLVPINASVLTGLANLGLVGCTEGIASLRPLTSHAAYAATQVMEFATTNLQQIVGSARKIAEFQT
jgi:hypothetical protein